MHVEVLTHLAFLIGWEDRHQQGVQLTAGADSSFCWGYQQNSGQVQQLGEERCHCILHMQLTFYMSSCILYPINI